jgi:hypothetical protein
VTFFVIVYQFCCLCRPKPPALQLKLPGLKRLVRRLKRCGPACRCNSKRNCVTTCKQAAKNAIAPAEAQLAAAKAEMDAAIARFKALEQVLRFKKQLKVLL